MYEKENNVNNLSSIIYQYKLNKLFPECRNNKIKLFEIAKRIFGYNNLIDGHIDLSNLVSYQFSKAKGSDITASNVWLKTAYEECLLLNNNDLLTFNREDFEKIFDEIKQYSKTKNVKSTLFNMQMLCNNIGINFYYRPSIPNSRIKAVAIKDKNEHIFIFVSSLFKCVENLWLAFMHELIHIKNNDLNCDWESNISIDVNENYVDEESAKYYIGNSFVDYKNITYEDIVEISIQNDSPINIVAEICRYKFKKYDDNRINTLINYYKDSDIDFCSPFDI